MKYKKVLAGVIAGVIFLGVFSACGKYSSDFKSSEEAQKYVLVKLEDKYNEKFTVTDLRKYKEEKIGLNWIIVDVQNKKNKSKTATVYARNTGYFKDDYHINYYSKKLEKLLIPLCQNKDYIKKYDIKIDGHMTSTKWNGKESLEEYLKKEEYTATLEIYLEKGKTDEQYAKQIFDWLKVLEKTDYNISVSVKVQGDDLIIFYKELGSLNKDLSKYSIEEIMNNIDKNRQTGTTIKNYKEWKKKNQKD